MGDLHFGCGDFFRGCVGEAEFADGEAFFAVVWIGFGILRTDGWAEDAAGHGAGCVDFASAGFGVEGGAGGVVGEVLEGLLGFFARVEDAGFLVAGEAGGEFFYILMGSACDFSGAIRGGCDHFGHGAAQAQGVEGVDGESSVAAGGAAGAAHEMRAGAAGGVDDLDQLCVLLMDFADLVGCWHGMVRRLRREGLP